MITIDASCPYCNTKLNRSFGLDPTDMPSTGDVNMCLHCGRWSIFELDGIPHLRRPTRRELIEIANDPDCQAGAMAWMRN